MAEFGCLGFLLGAFIDWSCRLSYAVVFDLVGCAVSTPHAMPPTRGLFTMLVTVVPFSFCLRSTAVCLLHPSYTSVYVKPGTTEVIAEAGQSRPILWNLIEHSPVGSETRRKEGKRRLAERDQRRE
ncbi:hypothetical protein ARMGADRAFT_690730 [Armillaria gallica]|uniref:Uncharacterized protein n=1 Tax=Armillaria gallica TaxID=47427 RepID=A0A2H3E4L5_ARMGA|nr:hypothetical protein ARMGADRAFT_690730 [Armillaria gallica]